MCHASLNLLKQMLTPKITFPPIKNNKDGILGSAIKKQMPVLKAQ